MALETCYAISEMLVGLGADVHATNHGGWDLLDGAAIAGDALARIYSSRFTVM